ncbi:MAG TPA: PDZ domain-containing protein [Dongiaceae bacterium]|nr:PDZ domain-containing protein [Dongiaceae bacterium]
MSVSRKPIKLLFRSFFLLVALQWIFSAAASATIRYEISLSNPAQHLFHVSMTVPGVRGELVVQMPAWNALYQVRDFASRVQRVEAVSDSGQALPVEKLDKQTWRVRGDGTVTLRYPVYWDTAGPFDAQLNDEHAFINPAMVLMYVPQRRLEDVTLALRDVPKTWQVATALDSSGADDSAARVFSAANYDALADGPLEAGTFKLFNIAGLTPPVSVLVHGDNWKQSEIEGTLRKLCEYELQLMGGAPYKRYLFIYHIGKAAGGAGGGMEHANSTAINLGNGSQVAGVSAHEFFHLWNVKRIRPASLEPVDYTREQYSRALWFAEGVTSTYGRYAQVRSGVWSKQDFYADLGAQINQLEARPANRWQSAEQSSLDTWLDKYDYYGGPEFSVSYYTKGQVLGVLLDILIRDRTSDARSLDDVLRRMNTQFARQGKTYRDSLDVRLTAEEVAGGSFEEFFRRYVASAEPLPYDSVLGKAGLLLQKQEVVHAELGFDLERDSAGKWFVRSVESGSGADRAGLRIGDEVTQWAGDAVPRRPEAWIRSRKPGDELRLRVLRNEQTQDFAFPLGRSTATMFVVAEDPAAAPKARAIREGILRGQPVAPAAAAAR